MERTRLGSGKASRRWKVFTCFHLKFDHWRTQTTAKMTARTKARKLGIPAATPTTQGWYYLTKKENQVKRMHGDPLMLCSVAERGASMQQG